MGRAQAPAALPAVRAPSTAQLAMQLDSRKAGETRCRTLLLGAEKAETSALVIRIFPTPHRPLSAAATSSLPLSKVPALASDGEPSLLLLLLLSM